MEGTKKHIVLTASVRGETGRKGRGSIVWASWNRTGSADFVKGRRVNMFPF